MAEIPKFFGIDIGYSSIKICLITSTPTEKTVQILGKLNVEGNLLQGNNEDDLEGLSSKISSLIKANKVDTKNCVIALAEHLIFSRLVSLPKIEEENLSEAIYWALKPMIPVSLDDVNVSYIHINDFVRGDKQYSNWYAVAAPKKVIQRYESVIKNMQLNLLAIETETLANVRSIVSNYQLMGDEIIVDFGANTSNIILIRNGKPAFSQTVEVGSEHLTKNIATDLGIDLVQAENYKLMYGYDTQTANGKIAQSMSQTLEALISEISRTMVYFRDKLGGSTVNRIYLTGGGANLKNFNYLIREKLNIECIVTNPFRNLKLSNQAKQDLEKLQPSSGLNLVVGLALKGTIDE